MVPRTLPKVRQTQVGDPEKTSQETETTSDVWVGHSCQRPRLKAYSWEEASLRSPKAGNQGQWVNSWPIGPSAGPSVSSSVSFAISAILVPFSRRSDDLAVRGDPTPTPFALVVFVELPLVVRCCHGVWPFLTDRTKFVDARGEDVLQEQQYVSHYLQTVPAIRQNLGTAWRSAPTFCPNCTHPPFWRPCWPMIGHGYVAAHSTLCGTGATYKMSKGDVKG